jgi:ADP-heptose:LPS heptosyltransferase
MSLPDIPCHCKIAFESACVSLINFAGAPIQSKSSHPPACGTGKAMSFKMWLLRLMAAAMATHRKGPARPELDRRLLPRQRIALVKLDGIGDFILATSFLQVFKRELPEADVTLFCKKPAGDLARQQFPGWTVVEISWPQKNLVRGVLCNESNRRATKGQPPFDLLLDLRTYRDFIETTIVSWIPARQKIALKNPRQAGGWQARLLREHRIYDQLLPPPDYARQAIIPDLQNHARLAGYLFPNLPGDSVNLPRLTISDEEKKRIAGRFAPDLDAPFLLVCPGAGASIREYPAAELAKAVIAAVSGTPLRVVIAGAKQDAGMADELAGALGRAGIKTLNLTGSLNLAEHAVLMSLARAVLCMETSHAHLAGALGRPAVVIIGGGHYGLFGPWGESPTFRWLTNRVPCFGCNWICTQDRPICIQDLPAAVIAKNLAEVLSLSSS